MRPELGRSFSVSLLYHYTLFSVNFATDCFVENKTAERSIMKKNIFIVCFLAMLALSVCRTTDIKAALKEDAWDYTRAITETEPGFKYYAYPSKDGKEAWIYGISCNYTNPKNTTLSIPKTIDGRKVTRIGEAYRTADERLNIFFTALGTGKIIYVNRIKKVIIPNTVEIIEPHTFGEFHRLETIKLPKNVAKIDKNTFYRCKKLKKVTLPEHLKELNPLAFSNCPNLKTLKLPSKNRVFQLKGRCLINRNDNALVFAAAGGKTIKIPDGVKTIRQNACQNVTATAVHIPASVIKLEENALTSKNIKDITVAANNTALRKDGQCIYRIKDKSLAAVLIDENRNLIISEHVEKITQEYSRVNYNVWSYSDLNNVRFPKNLKFVKVPGFSLMPAKNVYFTGTTPPKVTEPKENKWMGYSKLPTGCNVYVPNNSVKAYKAWYKKQDALGLVKWHTYDGSVPDIQTD